MNASAAIFSQDRGSQLEKRRILLVEDNQGDADLACERLAEAHSPSFDVFQAVTLAAAIDILSANSVDAIILDLGLPDSRGVETVRRLKLVSRETPIIVVSGLVDDALRTLAISEGAEEVFAKDETNSRLFWRSVLQIVEHRRVQNKQLQTLLDATPDAILVIDSSGSVRYVNRAAVDLFSRDREAFLGDKLDFALKNGELSEIIVPQHDDRRVCEMRVVQLDEWHDNLAFLAIIRDITERKQAEELRAHILELALQNRQIMEANRLKSEFLANISHELRTPLNAIIGFSDILHDGLVDAATPKQKECLGYILAGGNHLLQLINNLLDLATIEAGKIKFCPEPIELPKLIHEAVTALGVLSAEKNIGVQLELETSLVDVYLDPGRLKQVLYNFLSNALKFTPEGGSVFIRTKSEEGVAFRLEVEDTGVGIGQADIARLFSEFHQIESDMGRTQKGTGLGLALTRHLVEAQGGSVGVRSVVGKGSVFFAVLPQTAHLKKS
jgi:signal transduction histidine kinase